MSEHDDGHGNERDRGRGVLPPRLTSLLVDALGRAPAPALDALDAATIRERIVKRIRASKGLTTIQANEGEWESFSPKVKIKVLHRDVDTQSYLLRLEPGAVVLPHVHGQDEECMVLEGEVRIGDLVVSAGAYHLAPRGVPHEPISSEHGALLFLRGSIPAARQVRWGPRRDARADRPLIPAFPASGALAAARERHAGLAAERRRYHRALSPPAGPPAGLAIAPHGHRIRRRSARPAEGLQGHQHRDDAGRGQTRPPGVRAAAGGHRVARRPGGSPRAVADDAGRQHALA
jgi:quercetin dioxygenase-like cupin family protein